MAEPMEIHAPVPPAFSRATQIIRNPLLLQRIAKFLPADALLKLRKTCPDWNKTFLPHLKKKHPPIGLTPASHSHYKSSDSLIRYTNVMQNSKDIPFTKHRINLLTQATDQELLDFFTTCGPTITSLEFDSGTMDRVSRILYEWTPLLEDLILVRNQVRSDGKARQPPKQLPNLKRLQFHSRPPGSRDVKKIGDLREILEQATELENFEFILSDGGDAGNFSTIRFLQDYPHCLHKLRTLTAIPLELEVFQVLNGIANELRLDRFATNVNLDPSKRESNAELLRLFNIFLMTQARSLHELQINIYDYTQGELKEKEQHDREQVRIPKMETLNFFCLRQSGNCARFEEQTLGATFPALKRLEFGNWVDGGFMSLEELAQLRHEGVTELIWGSDSSHTRLNLAALRDWFPGVTRLEFTIGEAQLGELANLWTNWPALEFIYIKYFPGYTGHEQFNLDQLLSGVRKSELKKLGRELDEMDTSEINFEALRGLQRRYKPRFRISDQKHLQKFILEVHDEKSLEFWGYLGLAFAPQSLQFEIKTRHGRGGARSGGECLVSEEFEECLAFIRAALGPFAVINLEIIERSEFGVGL